jgi:hypothetical protein
MRRLILASLLMVVACGPTPTAVVATPSAAPAASPTPSSGPSSSPGPLLFAVLEANIAGSPYTWNTVAIAGLDGYARAKTTFVPMPVPDAGCMGALPPRSAHVAAGRVYFADGTGAVRSLSAQGQVVNVAKFPLTSNQQMLSFAVSPDGSRILGAVLTVPLKVISCSAPTSYAGLTLDVYTASAGSASTLLYHQNLADGQAMALTGWDTMGPRGTYPTVWASQGGGPASTLGVAVRIDAATGKVLGQVADPNSCRVWDISASGDFACIPDGASRVNIRRPDGSEVWHTTPSTPVNSLYGSYLSPDEQQVVVAGAGTDITEVWPRNGGRVVLSSTCCLGWLDSATLISGAAPNMLSYVRLSAPGTMVSLGFAGMFVGAI